MIVDQMEGKDDENMNGNLGSKTDETFVLYKPWATPVSNAQSPTHDMTCTQSRPVMR